jgi:hypothetical protein
MINPDIIPILSFTFVGALFIALGLPLALRKIKRNIFYGYRISIYVFENDDIWYQVNEMGGKHFVYIGATLIALQFINSLVMSKALTALSGIFLFCSILLSTIQAYKLTYKLAKKHGLKK